MTLPTPPSMWVRSGAGSAHQVFVAGCEKRDLSPASNDDMEAALSGATDPKPERLAASPLQCRDGQDVVIVVRPLSLLVLLSLRRSSNHTAKATAMESKHELAGPETSPPAPWSYWIVKNQFLGGCYPGAAGDEERTSELQSLLDVGMSTFINLMERDETSHNGKFFVPYEDRAAELASPRALTFTRHSIRDRSIPDAKLMTQILDAIDASVQSVFHIVITAPASRITSVATFSSR